MPTTKPEIEVRGLARAARRAGSGAMTREAHTRGRERLIAAIDRGAHTRSRSRSSLAFAVAAAAMVALVIVIVARRPEPAITFVFEGGAAGQRYVEAGPNGAVARFSDGTRIALAPGARGRVDAATARGAHVSHESGSARFDVVHRANAEWLVDAGPFTVTVTGTSFDLSWNGAEIEIAMHAGSIVLRGPPAPDGLALHAGQRVVADVKHASVSMIPSASVTATASGSPSISSAIATTSASATPRPREALPSWRTRVAAGEHAIVISEAEARGLDAVLEGASLADLAALADAARYTGRRDLAQRALVAERTRFPGSAEARSAAFLLGRMAESNSPASAVTWYDLYLAEAPGGSLAAEALGRKMIAIQTSAGAAAARATAEEYRRRFPDGPFAAKAAEILGDP